jgi:hypothetical protein
VESRSTLCNVYGCDIVFSFGLIKTFALLSTVRYSYSSEYIPVQYIILENDSTVD